MVSTIINKRVAVFCVLLAAEVISVTAQTNTSSRKLHGTVKDERGRAVETAYIVLNNSLSAFSDSEGKFVVSGIQSGQYDYYVSCLGYEEARGQVTLNGDDKDRLDIKLKEATLNLKEVVVTARQQAMGSRSVIGQDAIRHIQPKSVADMLQLMPGALTTNPTLNSLAQANIREIGGNDNNAMGTAVIIDGTPLSNEANLQSIAPTKWGAASSTNSDGMSDQTTAGRGVDLRTMAADNIESIEVIRGIPGVEYGNLTSGVVVVKTKAGRTPLEVKFKADPFSKLAYAGKGFALKNNGGTINLGIDWSQSYADVRRKYRGYDRVTASFGYSNVFGRDGAHPVTFNLNGSFYSNVNNYKSDKQLEELGLSYKNEHIGGHLAVHGNVKLNSFLTALDYDLSAQLSRQVDTHHNWVASPDGVITNSMMTGEARALILNKAYWSDYRMEGIPLNIYAQLKTNKYIQLNSNDYTNIRLGMDYRLDSNHGDGLTFNMANPPQASGSHTLRPRSYRDIPALHNVSLFFEDVSRFYLGKTYLDFMAGVRFSTLLLDKDKSGRGNISVAEPRVNMEYVLLNRQNNAVFDKLSISGGFGISNKMPTLLYLYPDKAYYDNRSMGLMGEDERSTLGIMTTYVVDNTQNPDIRPARSNKWEVGINARIGQMRGYLTFFSERHRHELGFAPQLVLLNYNIYNVPAGATDLNYTPGRVDYTYQGQQSTATITPGNEMATWGKPSNTSSSDKYGIEYSWDFGTFKPLSTQLNIDGAWLHIKRKTNVAALNFINLNYDFMPLRPAGGGTVSDRLNTNFRFITHLPVINMVFTTTVQVVWMESTRSIYQDSRGTDLYHLSMDGTRYVVSPLGFYDREGNWTDWQPSYENDSRYERMNDLYYTYSFKSDTVKPWTLINFRLTKELGRVAELSFMANNFLNISKYHTHKYSNSLRQLYPDMYFGAELKMKF